MPRTRNHRMPRRNEGAAPESEQTGPSGSALTRRLARVAAVPQEVPRDRVIDYGERTLPSIPRQAEGVSDGDYEVQANEPDDMDEAWEATLPEPTPEDIATATAQAIHCLGVSDGDLDRLWDWIRQDEDQGKKFLGITPETSTALRERVGNVGPMFHTIYEEPIEGGPLTHIGFVGLTKVPGLGDAAMVSIYLAHEVRGRLREIAPRLLALAEERYPDFKRFSVYTDDHATARLYRGLGFKVNYLLTLAR